MAVNAGVQLLLSPGDPLTLLRRELDTRLLAVEQSLRRLAGNVVTEPPAASLNSLAIAGMSRPLALLKTASIIHRWARERHEELAAIITLIGSAGDFRNRARGARTALWRRDSS